MGLSFHGLVNRVQKLLFFTKNEKLKLLLMGSILKQGSSESTLSLEDFSTGEKIASRATPCPNNNSGFFSALKKF